MGTIEALKQDFQETVLGLEIVRTLGDDDTTMWFKRYFIKHLEHLRQTASRAGVGALQLSAWEQEAKEK